MTLLFVILSALGWFGDVMALLGSYFVGCSRIEDIRKGWKCFLVADLSLIGLPLYLHAWNLAVLYAAFLVLGIRGIIKSHAKPKLAPTITKDLGPTITAACGGPPNCFICRGQKRGY